MLIYIFAEHYPTPYKPQFDTEFAFFLRQGHQIKIFAAGQYTSTIHPRVRSYGLDKKTHLFPTTLKTLPRFFKYFIFKLILSPKTSFNRILAIKNPHLSFKKNILRISRMLVLPDESPDLCYIHNIATGDMIDFLPQLYPSSRVAMYFHGGEVGGVQRIVRDSQLFEQAHIVFTNTKFSRRQAIERGCPPDRIIAVPVGFDLSDYPVGKNKKYREGGLLNLISVGRLSEEKGLVFALDAVSELIAKGFREIHYTIVGRGMLEGFLKEYVLSKGLESYVDFVGERDKAGVVDLLEKSDVLVLPSIVTETWAETQAAVVQEAMLMRLLVVTTQAGGVPESTADVMRQFSVPICDVSAISKQIGNILALPEMEMARLGEEAREFAFKRFNIDHTGLHLLEYAMGRKSSVVDER